MPEPLHEPTTIAAGPVNRVLLVAVLLLLAALLLSGVYWRHLFPKGAPPPAIIPPEPRLQTQAPQDLARLRAEQQAQLGRYAWIDRRAGVAQIPIERAMALLAQRQPARPPAAPQP
jgi:hypothetical protein